MAATFSSATFPFFLRLTYCFSLGPQIEGFTITTGNKSVTNKLENMQFIEWE